MRRTLSTAGSSGASSSSSGAVAVGGGESLDTDGFLSQEEEEDGTDGARHQVSADRSARADVVLATAAPHLSRSRVQALIRAGAAQLNGAPFTEPSRKVVPGDELSLTEPPPAPAAPQPEAIALAVLFEDDEIIVIDKPAGLVVHPAAGHPGGTLVNALLHHCGASLSGIGGVARPGIVHRLDKDTSGVMVAAKTDRAHRALSAQFADHGRTGVLRRRYDALAWGALTPARGTVDRPIGRHPADRQRFAVNSAGRHAVTHYETLEAFADVSLLSCRLETGRTHQIRVHMAALGAPLLGDPLYGAGFATKAARLPPAARDALAALSRQALHAAHLAIAHPVSGETLTFDAPHPADFHALLTALRT